MMGTEPFFWICDHDPDPPNVIRFFADPYLDPDPAHHCIYIYIIVLGILDIL